MRLAHSLPLNLQKIKICKTAIRSAFTVTASLLLLASCGGDKGKSKTPPTESLSSWSELQGTWIPRGYGQAYEISEDNSINVYSFTQKTCFLVEKSNTEAFDKEFINLELGRTKKRTTLKVHHHLDTSEYRKITLEKQSTPNICKNTTQITDFDPQLMFDHIYHSFLDYHPFFDLYDVKWRDLYSQYAPSVTPETTETELFWIIAKMLEPIDDGHTSISYQDNAFSGEKEAGFAKTASQMFYGNFFYCLSEGNTEEDCTHSIPSYLSVMSEFTATLEEHYSVSPLKFEGFDGYQLGYGTLKNNIGYIQINQMLGYSAAFADILESGEFVFDKEVEAIHPILDKVLTELDATNGIIIDVRVNTGGSDPVALAIAERFTEERTKAFEKQRNVIGTWRELEATYLDPHDGVTYFNPVVLVTGPETGSGAEIFTLAMRALPQVTHIGEPTAGDLSDRYEVLMPEALADAWQATYANERYISHDGIAFEAIGVQPEHTVPVTSYISSKTALLPTIDKAFEILEADPITIDRNAYITAVQEVLDTAGIPGFAAAIVSKDEILATEALGFADIENQIAVTQDTPFNLGSISKAVMGTAISKAIDDESLSLDLELQNSDLPFSIDHPHDTINPLKLRHLVTHTSSIIDSNEILICMYYLAEDQSSFANQYIDGIDYCPEPAIANQSDFIAELLNEDGAFYSEDYFLSFADDPNDPIPPGYINIYSNVAASLAGEVFVSEVGQSIDAYTQQNVFNPTNMTNTYWQKPQEVIQPEFARRYLITSEGPFAIPDINISLWSTGQLHSSASDLAKFLHMIADDGEYNGNQVLTPSTIQRMLSNQGEEGGSYLQQTPLGHLGIFWNNDNYVFSHNGSDMGANAQLFYDIESDLGIVLMVNASAEDEVNFAATFDLLTQLTTLYGKNLKRTAQ